MSDSSNFDIFNAGILELKAEGCSMDDIDGIIRSQVGQTGAETDNDAERCFREQIDTEGIQTDDVNRLIVHMREVYTGTVSES